MDRMEMTCTIVIVASMIAGHITSVFCALYSRSVSVNVSRPPLRIFFARSRSDARQWLRIAITHEKDSEMRSYALVLLFMVNATYGICVAALCTLVAYSVFLHFGR